MNIRSAVCATLAASLTACASPQPAHEQANFGAELIGKLETSLAEFRRRETNAQNERRQSQARQLADLRDAQAAAGSDLRARLAAGDVWTPEVIKRLEGNADGLAQDEATVAASLKTDEATLAALLTPLPSTAKATADAQAKLAVLGADLPAHVRVAEARAFFDAVRKDVDDNRKKIAAAEAAKTKAAAEAAAAGH